MVSLKMKMNLPIKLSIGSAGLFLFIILVGFVGFPMLIKSKVKKMVNLGPGTEIRDMFLELPFPLKFKVYLFNVTNPMEVQAGALPQLKEVGPFCYDQWKKKANISDNEDADTISYYSIDTFIKTREIGCKSGDIEITIPHPMILGPTNAVKRTSPGTLSIVNKAFKSIYNNPNSLFITARADDLLFNGIDINCGVSDFAGKATCLEFKKVPDLWEAENSILKFSFLRAKNGTLQKRIKTLRGTKNHLDVGRIVEYDGSPTLSTWPTKSCNIIYGTDSTIFPPMLKKEEGLANFSPDLCRSLVPYWVKTAKYHGIPVNVYEASLGDMSKNVEEKCYCYTPETCQKKGVMDLFKCNGVAPLYASLPHFYDSDSSFDGWGVNSFKPKVPTQWVQVKKSLNGEMFKGILIISFRTNGLELLMTGGPVQARKRLQFSMPLEKTTKVDLFKNLTDTVIPLFWVEEGLDLNSTYTKPIKMLYTLKKLVNILTWTIIVASLGGFVAGGYLFYKDNNMVKTITEKKSPGSGISKVGDVMNKVANGNEANKF